MMLVRSSSAPCLWCSPYCCTEDNMVARVPNPEDSHWVPLSVGQNLRLIPCFQKLLLLQPAVAEGYGSEAQELQQHDICGHIRSYQIISAVSWRIGFPSEMPCCTVLTGTSAIFTCTPSTGYISIPTSVGDERKISSRCGFNSWRHYNSLAGCYNLTAQARLHVCMH